jgi:hypothetical protein
VAGGQRRKAVGDRPLHLPPQGMDMLRKIHNTRSKLLGGAHIATGEAKYILVSWKAVA